MTSRPSGSEPALSDQVAALIRDIPDFPHPGVLFKDITPVLSDHLLFRDVVDWMVVGWGSVDKVVGIESRGFVFGAALVHAIDAGFVPARKQGKLPFETVAVDYDCEYSSATLEMHVDALKPGDRVLIVDDLLATGGTCRAAIELVEKLGATVVGCCFLVELTFLDGRQRLTNTAGAPVEVRSLVKY